MENIDAVSKLYENSGVPVAVITSEFEVVYQNNAAKKRYPLLSRPDGIDRFIPEGKRESLKAKIKERKGASSRAYDSFYSGTVINITEISDSSLYLLHFAESDGFCEPFSESKDFMAVESICRTALSELFASLTHVSQVLETHGEYDNLTYVDTISNSGYKLLRTITDLTEYNRLTSAEPGLKKQGVNIKELVKDVGNLSSTLVKNNGIPVKVNVDDCENLFVLADSERIMYAISHLISNSVKYTREGNEITVSLKRVGSNALIAVSDKGTGIKKELMSSIFKPFFSYCPMDIPFSAVGLGLTIVKLIVELSGGSVFIKSEENEGTSVSFSLPVVDELDETVIVKNESLPFNRFSKVYVGLAGSCRYSNVF